MREQTVAHRSAPPSEPANRWFLRPSATGRIARSTELLSSSMRPSSRKRHSADQRVRAYWIASARPQPLESGITVNLQNATKSFEVGGGSLRLAIGTVKVDGCRRIGPTPRPIVARIDPQSAGLGATAAGIQHRDRRVVGEDFGRAKHVSGKARLQRLQPPARTTDPVR